MTLWNYVKNCELNLSHKISLSLSPSPWLVSHGHIGAWTTQAVWSLGLNSQVAPMLTWESQLPTKTNELEGIFLGIMNKQKITTKDIYIYMAHLTWFQPQRAGMHQVIGIFHKLYDHINKMMTYIILLVLTSALIKWWYVSFR